MQKSKSPLKSKTLWFNVLSLAGIVIADEHFKNIVGDHTMILFMLQSMINIGLRFVTKEPVSVGRKSLDMF